MKLARMLPVMACSLMLLAESVTAQSTNFILSSSPFAGAGPDSIAVLDVNGDGRPDLVVADSPGKALYVLTNNGAGLFVSNTIYVTPVTPVFLITADVNGDGKPDLIYSSSDNNSLTVLTNNGSGVFVSSAVYFVPGAPYDFVAADINGDGKADLIVADYSDSTVTVLTNNGTGNFVSSGNFGSGGQYPRWIAVADYNGDGKPDLAVADYFMPHSLAILNNNGNGVFAVSSSVTVGGYAFGVVTADVNGDGKPDLISSAGTGGNVLSVCTNNGNGTFTSVVNYTVGPSPSCVIVVTNVNGDGKPDLICENGDNTLTILTNNGVGLFAVEQTVGVGIGVNFVTAADVNGDGKLDLIASNAGTNTLSVLTNAGAFTVLVPTNIIVNPAGPFVAVGLNLPFTATEYFNDGSTQTVTNGGAVNFWSGSNPAVASITTNGVVTALAAGTTTITATSGGISGSTTLTVFNRVTTWYVWTNSPANGPGDSWADAFHDIQSAVNLTTNGDTVLVTNGFYATGGVPLPYGTTNRVYITNAITLRSVNGPGVTAIIGSGYQYDTRNDVRCVSITATNVLLSGFTLTNGYIGAADGGGVAGSGPGNAFITNCILTGDVGIAGGGGAIECTLNNCILTNDLSDYGGGGAWGCTLNNCLLINNVSVVSPGGGAYGSSLNNCAIIGNSNGGVASCTVNDCIVASNINGSGATGGTLNNCLVYGNSGGGAWQATLTDCTVVSNTSPYSGGGVSYCGLNNCIVYDNSAPNFANYDTNSGLTYCDSLPLAPGPGNISADPLFTNAAAGDFHLLATSPCIDAGDNALVVGATDLDGDPRIIGGTVDLGAYEYQSVVLHPPVISMQPTNNVVSPNGGVTLQVSATGSGLSYQWQLYGTNISGATGATLTIPNVTVTNVGVYTVVVSNLGGSVTSQAAIVGTTAIQMFAGVIVNGPLGSNYVIQSTPGLGNGWTTRTNLTLPSQPYIYIDYSSPTNPQQFYRAMPQ